MPSLWQSLADLNHGAQIHRLHLPAVAKALILCDDVELIHLIRGDALPDISSQVNQLVGGSKKVCIYLTCRQSAEYSSDRGTR